MKKHIAITSCPIVEQIIMPKLKLHDMTVFNYYRVYFDGKMIRLSSDQAWTEHYFQKNYMNTMTVPKSYLSKPLNYYVWLTDDCPEMLIDAAVNFNTSNGISIAEKHTDYIEYFCFATHTQNTRIINNFYLNNLDLLLKYGHEFKEEADQLLKIAKKQMLQIQNMEVCHADCRFAEIKPYKIKLSSRQTDCARLLLEGFQYNEIASQLKLSTRSIEYYVENLKAKLECRNKSELIIKLTQLIHI